MFRHLLASLIRPDAERCGYTFFQGPARGIASRASRFPVLWLEPPVLTSLEGRSEGTVTYRVTMHLLSLGNRGRPAEALWEEMEDDAVLLFRTLADTPRVLGAAHLRCTASADALTHRGDIALTAVFDLTFAFAEPDLCP